MGLIIAIIAGIFGKRIGEKQAVVTKRDIVDGIVIRKIRGDTLEKTYQAAMHDAKVRGDEVSQQIKEAPNEEIVRMFIDAFDKPAGHRSD